MKRIIFTLCVLAIVLTGCVPVYAAAENRSYYPMEGGYDAYRIRKVYQLSLSDDPSLIPTEDFERQGCTWHLLDMTRKDDVGVDTQPYTETITKPSDTNKMETILQNLDEEEPLNTDIVYQI